MQTAAQPAARKAGAMEWTGRILSGLIAAWMLVGAAMDLTRNPVAVNGLRQAGYPDNALLLIGVAVLISAILYAVPRTAILGAVLLTGYMGGAVNTHVHAGNQVPQMCVAFFVGMLVWLGIWLREPRLRALLPLR